MISAYTYEATVDLSEYYEQTYLELALQTEYDSLLEKNDALREQFSKLYGQFLITQDRLYKISRNTGFQAVMYDEQENFQSYEILDNFNYPFANRKQVRDEF